MGQDVIFLMLKGVCHCNMISVQSELATLDEYSAVQFYQITAVLTIPRKFKVILTLRNYPPPAYVKLLSLQKRLAINSTIVMTGIIQCFCSSQKSFGTPPRYIMYTYSFNAFKVFLHPNITCLHLKLLVNVYLLSHLGIVDKTIQTPPSLG